ncbi:hypothetical protein AAIB33_06455 [Microbacterium sp. AZCO]|uniref:hypothetical protein n=1 Tax=Microbacterium sp. AZCO TaxID=3142976 RepID=UPI0031F4710D
MTAATDDEREDARARMEGLLSDLEARAAPGAEWFGATPLLRHIREWARSLDVNPFAALGVVMARLSGDIPPWVVLPPLAGSAPGTLNLYVVLAGGSGMGKSDVLSSHDQRFRPRPGIHNDPVRAFEPATGEGIITRYVQMQKLDGRYVHTMVHHQAFADIDEIDALEAQAYRGGSTIVPVLKTMWSGKAIGTATATEERDRHLDAHSYRLALVAGCQYGAGDVLLGARAQLGGLTQRFLFANLRDPDLTADSPETDAPAPVQLRLPDGMPFPTALGGEGAGRHVGGRFVVRVDAAVHSEMRRARRLQRMHQPGGVDGHWQYTRLRVAALLAIAHGDATVTVDWWQLAHGVMLHSDRTRNSMLEALTVQRDREASGRGRSDGIRADAADAELIARAATTFVQIAAKHAATRQHADAGCTLRCMTQGAPRHRDRAEAALTWAVDRGMLLHAERKNRRGRDTTHYSPPPLLTG